MSTLLVFLFVFSLVLKIFPASKPNYFYGYQLGSAKVSKAHWKVAQAVAPNYLMVLYGLSFGLNWFLEAKEYDGVWILALLLPGSVLIYVLMERRLSRVNDEDAD
ncbi:MAG: hypothetical protein RL607_1975 [Bacteroidota bacterium]|jgi:uncharacterized membrane protein